ncbi:type II secretion system protein [Idiomarina sp. Sol25]|uniref:type II secretion system protein n=1 Tax=Idiomarina sp. Sol25 TaxID=3064000 RepID=UPI00294B27EB|nr:type II secretion system protein [Idiomarina sp. Sol25]MDV6327876.1 type II secretion system protein [Idiomarina sp. Sol25]
MRNQKGFTLIELIIVIVVLGILAVTAAPQFINFSSDARASALKGMEGSIKGATQLTYSKAAVEGKESAASGESISVKGNTVDLVYGYPAASGTGIINAVDGSFDTNLSADWVYEEGTQDDGSGGTEPSGEIFIAQSSSVTGSGSGGDYASGDIASSNCYLTYKVASSSEPATVAVSEDSGC